MARASLPLREGDLTTRQVSELTGIKYTTLVSYRYKTTNPGPKFRKYGNVWVCSQSEVDRWLDAHGWVAKRYPDLPDISPRPFTARSMGGTQRCVEVMPLYGYVCTLPDRLHGERHIACGVRAVAAWPGVHPPSVDDLARVTA